MTETQSHTIPDLLREIAEMYALLPLLLTSRPPTDIVGTRKPPGPKPPMRLDILHLANRRPAFWGDQPDKLAEINTAPCEHQPAPKDVKPCPCRDSDGIQGLLPDMWVEAKMVAYELETYDPQLPDELPDDVTLSSLIAWYLKHWSRYEKIRPREAELTAADVRRWHRKLRHITGERDPYQPKHTGRGGCGWPIHAVDTEDAGVAYYVCSGCGTTFNHHAELTRLAHLQAPITLREVAVMANVTLRTAQRWVEDGRLLPITDKGEKPARYRVIDVNRIVRKSA